MLSTLLRLTLEDMADAAAVMRASFDARLPWLTGLHSPEEDRAFFRDQLFPRCQIWGAVEGGLVGIIAFRPGWVDQLYLLPGSQGRGLGTALLDQAKAAAAELQLWTFQENTATRRFYEARGFVAVRQTDGSANEEREPDVLYRWARPPAPAP